MKQICGAAFAGAGALALLAATSASAQSDTYQINYTAVVTSVYNSQGLLDGSVVDGTSVNASLIFQYPSQATTITPGLASYLFTGTPGGVTATFGDYTYVPTAASGSGFLVGNDLGLLPPADFVLYGSEGGLLSNASGTAPAAQMSGFTTELVDLTGTALASDALPTSYDLAAFPIRDLQFGEGSGGKYSGFDATLLSVTVKKLGSPLAVPEPSACAVWLFGAAGVGGLILFRRRAAV